jgi:hypothetical protein
VYFAVIVTVTFPEVPTTWTRPGVVVGVVPDVPTVATAVLLLVQVAEVVTSVFVPPTVVA